MGTPKAWFKLVNPEGAWDRVPLTAVEYIADLKSQIKAMASVSLKDYDPAQLTLKATMMVDDDSQARELDPLNDLASVLTEFEVESPGDIATVAKLFADNIWLFVSTPVGKVFKSISSLPFLLLFWGE